VLLYIQNKSASASYAQRASSSLSSQSAETSCFSTVLQTIGSWLNTLWEWIKNFCCKPETVAPSGQGAAAISTPVQANTQETKAVYGRVYSLFNIDDLSSLVNAAAGCCFATYPELDKGKGYDAILRISLHDKSKNFEMARAVRIENGKAILDKPLGELLSENIDIGSLTKFEIGFCSVSKNTEDQYVVYISRLKSQITIHSNGYDYERSGPSCRKTKPLTAEEAAQFLKGPTTHFSPLEKQNFFAKIGLTPLSLAKVQS
jgi:hypothetical protein